MRFNPMDGLIRDATSSAANIAVRCKVRASLWRRTSANPTQMALKTLIFAMVSTLEAGVEVMLRGKSFSSCTKSTSE